MGKNREWGAYWDRVRANRAVSRKLGLVTITRVRSRIHVSAPYDDAFRRGAIELGGRYRQRAGVWSFHGQTERLVRLLIRKVFGDATIREGGQ